MDKKLNRIFKHEWPFHAVGLKIKLKTLIPSRSGKDQLETPLATSTYHENFRRPFGDRFTD